MHGIFDINNNLQIFIITLPNKMDEVKNELSQLKEKLNTILEFIKR